MPRPTCLLAIFFLIQTLAAQNPPDIHDRIRGAVTERNYLVAITDLRELEKNNTASFTANNYDYLLGRLSEKIGDTATAMANFQSVVNRNSVLKEYALWHLSRLARGSGNLTLERIYLQELIAFSQDSLLLVPANRRLAESWFDSGNYDLAIRQLEHRPASPGPTISRNSAARIARGDSALLAEAYLQSGNVARARELFTALTTNLANPAQPDDFALAGVRGLDTLDSTRDVPNPLTDYEHLKRASIYQFNRDFARARFHYSAIINEHTASGLVPDAVFQIGRGFAQQGNYTEALKSFERVLEQFPDQAASQEALLQTASAYARLGKYPEAVTRYKKYIGKYPEGERVDRAYLNIIDTLRDQREETEAVKWAETIREKFKGKQPEALATFAEARIYLARTDWANTLSTLDKLQSLPDLGGTEAPGGTNLIEVRFLRGFALEQLRRYDQAIDIYLSIPDGRNEYYGGRATERLRSMREDKTTETFVAAKETELRGLKPTDPDGSRRILQSRLRLTPRLDERLKLLAELRTAYVAVPLYASPKFRLAAQGRRKPADGERLTAAPERGRMIPDELLFLGLYDEAAPEVEARGGTTSRNETGAAANTKGDLDYTLAVLYTRGDMAYRGSEFIESAWKIPADYQIELIPAEAMELLYPAPYVGALSRHAARYNVDPRFLLAVMRQESRFRPDVKSYAAARGLMQFISTTASRVAAELDRSDFRQDDLYDPSTSILFGSYYAGNLFKLFPGQPPAVAASYNGGEDNMARWLRRAKADQPDRYIPEIVFSQSKDYVWRVMANYRAYQMLYDENLIRK